MEENLVNNILKICKALNKYSVEYLIVGGTAVAFHGYYRMSIQPNNLPADKHDLDFWFNPTYKNYFNLLNSMETLGIIVTEFKEELAPNPKKSYFRHDFGDFKIDFLPEIIGLKSFREAFSNRIVSNIDGIEICTISLEDLIKSKEASLRNKDMDDINNLKFINRRE
jgi:predicted nucleotidyltransferase